MNFSENFGFSNEFALKLSTAPDMPIVHCLLTKYIFLITFWHEQLNRVILNVKVN